MLPDVAIITRSWQWQLITHLLVRGKSQVLPTLQGRKLYKGVNTSRWGHWTLESTTVINLYSRRSASLKRNSIRKVLYPQMILLMVSLFFQLLTASLRFFQTTFHPSCVHSCISFLSRLCLMMTACTERLILLFSHLSSPCLVLRVEKWLGSSGGWDYIAVGK